MKVFFSPIWFFYGRFSRRDTRHSFISLDCIGLFDILSSSDSRLLSIPSSISLNLRNSKLRLNGSDLSSFDFGFFFFTMSQYYNVTPNLSTGGTLSVP